MIRAVSIPCLLIEREHVFVFSKDISYTNGPRLRYRHCWVCFCSKEFVKARICSAASNSWPADLSLADWASPAEPRLSCCNQINAILGISYIRVQYALFRISCMSAWARPSAKLPTCWHLAEQVGRNCNLPNSDFLLSFLLIWCESRKTQIYRDMRNWYS